MYKKALNINCDLGEGMPNDSEVMPYIQSCNIACGGHTGDVESIRNTIRLAKRHQVKVGAHPSYPDRSNFGRVSIEISNEDLILSLKEQINLFKKICEEEGVAMHHIKLHGALYNDVSFDSKLSQVLIDILKNYKETKLYVPSGSILAELAAKELDVSLEGFIDRAYTPDLKLRPRSQEGALITDTEEALTHFKDLMSDQIVVNGQRIKVNFDILCIHGDNPQVVDILKAIRKEYYPRIRRFGDAILLEWWNDISEELRVQVKNTEIFLIRELSDESISFQSAYQSLLITSTRTEGILSLDRLNDLIQANKAQQEMPSSTKKTRIWVLPVVYDGKDLHSLSIAKEMSVEEVISKHSSGTYPIHFMGFLPGFPYLGGLDTALHYQRKEKPELRIEAGSVAIGGSQTGIYVQNSPGGWHVIGRTLSNLFQPNRATPVEWNSGDYIRFKAVSSEELQDALNHPNYELKLEADD